MLFDLIISGTDYKLYFSYSPLYLMLYTRNKECFKKSTTKVQNNDIRRNIINLVKEVVKRDTCLKIPVHQSNNSNQNKCKNYPMQDSQQKPTLNHMFKEAKSPIFCESIYQSHEVTARYRKKLSIEHVLDYSIKSSDHPSKSTFAQKQYICLLEEKIQKIEKQLTQERQTVRNNNQTLKLDEQKQLERLLKFYHSARNILILQSVEILQCKNILTKDLQANDTRLKSINSIMSKSQQLLETFKRSIEKGSPRKPRFDEEKKLDLQQLREQCQYQQKTIEFLRKQAPIVNQFNEIRLLRYEINRVCNQNEELLSKIQRNKQEPIQNKENIQKIIKQVKLKSSQEIEQRERVIQKLQKQIMMLNQQLKDEGEKNFKLKQEKQCLFSFLDEAKFKNQQLQMSMAKYEQEIHLLKMSTLKSVGQINLDGKQISTTQQLCKQLKAYPKYFKLLMNIISQYESKISQLQDKVCQERQEKQKFMQWSTQVYQLLQKSELPEEVIKQHMNRLYTFNNKLDCSNIQKYLRQIRSLSIGIDNKQVKQMEAELQQYIISLKARNQVIKEVDCEDGSSVAVSDSFTDQDFDQ